MKEEEFDIWVFFAVFALILVGSLLIALTFRGF